MTAKELRKITDDSQYNKLRLEAILFECVNSANRGSRSHTFDGLFIDPVVNQLKELGYELEVKVNPNIITSISFDRSSDFIQRKITKISW